MLFSVMLVNMCVIYVDNISHFELSVCFCIKFCVKNEIKCARAFETLIVAFDDVHSSRPSMLRTDENIERVMEMILYNRRITVRERLLMMLA